MGSVSDCQSRGSASNERGAERVAGLLAGEIVRTERRDDIRRVDDIEAVEAFGIRAGDHLCVGAEEAAGSTRGM